MFMHILYMANSLPHPWISPTTFSRPGIQRGQGADALSDHNLAFFHRLWESWIKWGQVWLIQMTRCSFFLFFIWQSSYFFIKLYSLTFPN